MPRARNATLRVDLVRGYCQSLVPARSAASAVAAPSWAAPSLGPQSIKPVKLKGPDTLVKSFIMKNLPECLSVGEAQSHLY